MNPQTELLTQDIHDYLKTHEHKSLLRFITCGSVDDGKSTLIGRLLFDSKMVFEDQLAALESDSKRVGTQGEKIDYALLLDGLQAEREQGITIDVAYRYFATEKRKFIVADTPGHEQYTRNMVTGASTAQAAVILVDARKGLLTQTRRHSYLVSLVGIRHLVLAINKMDLVDYSPARFKALEKEYRLFAASLGFSSITAIPISALEGDNIIESSGRTPWYDGPTLLEHLETLPLTSDIAAQPFRMRVQWVNRPHLDFRGFAGTIAAGRVRPGDPVVVTASGQSSRVARIVTFDGDLDEAVAGQAVTLTLEDEIDISRGDLLSVPASPPAHGDRFRARLVWLHEQPLQPQRSYLIKAGATTAPLQIRTIDHKVNVNTLQPEAGESLQINEVGVAELSLGQHLSFDRYADNRATGSFIVIDRQSNATVAAGMIEEQLQTSDAAPEAPPTTTIYWLSGAAAAVAGERLTQRLHWLGRPLHHLDATALRLGLNSDLGSAAADRKEENRRLLEVARLFADSGRPVLVSALQPPNQGLAIDGVALKTFELADESGIEQFIDTFCS